MHPSERARAFRETVSMTEIEDELHGQSVRRLVSTIQPDSDEEREALRKIDAIRAGGQICLSCEGVGCESCDNGIQWLTTSKQRLRRARAYWGDRDHALNG